MKFTTGFNIHRELGYSKDGEDLFNGRITVPKKITRQW